MKLAQRINDAQRSYWYRMLGIPFEIVSQKEDLHRSRLFRRLEDRLDAQAVFSSIHVHTKRIRFPNAGGLYLPTERASTNDIGTRQQAASILAIMKNWREKEVPFVHLWHLPASTERLFGFRIDTDFAGDQEINDLYQLCRKYDIPATWFVEVKSRKNNLGIFKDMEGQEIAYHCFRHKLLHSRSDMSRDILEGLRYMKLAGLKPRGYAAPYGEWRPFLSELLKEYGFQYSSEFGLAYDAMPFYPPGKEIQTLPPQIPIHPISVNRLKHAHHSPSQMTAYYLNVLYQNGTRRIPTFLYHHPGQGYLQVWEAIFRNVREKGIPVMSMGDYAAWWKRRSELNWSAEWVDGKVKLHCNEPADDIRVCVRWPEGGTELHSFNPDIAPIAIDYKFRIKMAGKELHSEIDPELNRYTTRMFRHDLIWYYGRLKQ